MSKAFDLIQQYYDCFNRQDMIAFLNLLSEDVVHDINQGDSEKGKKAFSQFMTRMNHCYKETVKNLVIMVSQDEQRAAAEFVIEGTYLATDAGLPEAKGQHYQLPCGAFFIIQQGKITRITNYYNLNDWLKQIESK